MTVVAAPPLVRCAWASGGDVLYARYHDEEWGVPQPEGRALFEKLVLEGFQAGLSWVTILRKRENFRRAFADFDAARMARFGDRDIARLMTDPGIVRSRAKIEAAIENAKAYLRVSERTPFAEFVWSAAGSIAGPSRHTHQDVPAETPASRALAKSLRAEGFRFVGPTTAYAFMQSVGMANDHLVTCHRHGPCAQAQAAFVRPGAHAAA